MMPTADDLTSYLPLVERIASRYRHRLPRGAEEDDLVSAGVCGLLEARTRWDGRVPFGAFAYQRVQGAVVDELRRLDDRGRGGRARAAARWRAESDLRQELGREVTRDEIAARLGDEEDDSDADAALAHPPQLLSELLTELSGGEDERLAGVEARDALAQALRVLSERERTVLALIYQEQLGQREAAAVLGVSARRFAALHARAILGLRQRLSGRSAARSD